MKTFVQIALLSMTILLCGYQVTAQAAPVVKIGKYANDAVFRGEFRWHIILNADKTFTLVTGDYEGIYTMTGTWTSDSSGNVTAKIANGKTVRFTGGGSDVLTLTVWPYGHTRSNTPPYENAFNNTPLYYVASQAAAPAQGTPPAAAENPASPLPATTEKPAPSPSMADAPKTPATTVTSPPALPKYPPLVHKDGKPVIKAHMLRVENGLVDAALQILAPGKTVEAVRIDNVGGVSSAWRSDGKDAAAPLTVMEGDVFSTDGTAAVPVEGKEAMPLADGTASMSLTLGKEEKLLLLRFVDNGAVAGGETDLRVTVFFTDKTRAMCLLPK